MKVVLRFAGEYTGQLFVIKISISILLTSSVGHWATEQLNITLWEVHTLMPWTIWYDVTFKFWLIS